MELQSQNTTSVGQKTTISELYCRHFDLNLLPKDINIVSNKDEFSHFDNVDIKDVQLTIIEFQHYDIPYGDDWYMYIVLFESLNVYSVIRYGGSGSERIHFNLPIDVEIIYFGMMELSLAYTEFTSIGPW